MPRGDGGSLDLDVQPANSKGNEGISNNILAIRTIVWNENPLLAVSVDRDDKMSFYSMPRGHGVEVAATPFRRRCSC